MKTANSNNKKNDNAEAVPVTAPEHEGYMEDAMGRLVPIENIAAVDLMRDELVRSIVGRAKRLAELVEDFKFDALDEIAAFVEISAEQYGVKIGGKKGNVKLHTYDGSLYLQRAMADRIVFDERLQVAKALIDECLNEWSEGSAPELKTIVMDAFSVDKEGKIATHKILSLRRLDIKHETWQLAMQAINDSIAVLHTATYIRFYERLNKESQYRQICIETMAL